MSVLYSKAKLAAACAGIVYFLSYVPYMYVAIREEAAGDKISFWAKSVAVSIRISLWLESNVCYYCIYENNLGGKQKFTKYLNQMAIDQHFSF